jgi:hypothetical protein
MTKDEGKMNGDPNDTTNVDETRIDRRRRHANDPTMSITVNVPVSLRTDLDRVTGEMGWTRSGAIVAAIREWLGRQDDDPRDGSAH